jgi:nucleoside-diphosphate-sugar epimerase
MKKLTGNKYLVTGGAGFIGSHICEEIVKQGKKVICLDNVHRTENLEEWWNPKLCTFLQADITNPWKTDMEHFKDVDVVFHNAASKCTVCTDDPSRDLMVNALGSLNVFMAAQKVGAKVVHASTGSVNNGMPKSYYGVSKQAAESYLYVMKEYYPDFRFSLLRYYHVYGPRQNESDKGGVIPIFIRNVLTGQPVCVTGDGGQVRHFTYVKDVVNANFIAAERETTGAIDVVSDTSISILDLAKMVSAKGREVVDGTENIEFTPARKGDIRYFRTENAEIKAHGLEFTDFNEGFHKTFKWYAERHILNGLYVKWAGGVASYEKKTHGSNLMRKNIPYTIEIGNRFRKFMGLNGARKKILDIGCGNGLMDDKKYSEIGLRYVEPRHDLYGCDVLDYQDDFPGQFYKANAEDLPFDNNFFDATVCASALDHLIHPWNAFIEAQRVLKPGGTFFLSQGILHDNPMLKVSTHKHHIFDFSIKSIKTLFGRTGFINVEYQKADVDKDCVVWFFKGEKRCD